MSNTGDKPQYLSPSRLADFQACPRRYQHVSVDRVRQPASYASAKGSFVHAVFESLFHLPVGERTRDAAISFLPEAATRVLTDVVKSEIGYDEVMAARLDTEARQMIERYFIMEDPNSVVSEGVELPLNVTIDGAPLYGILDRLDRDENDDLVIVDYKTGAVPSRNFDSQTFANAEIYALMCQEATAPVLKRPVSIRLHYVAAGVTLERPVTPVVLRARREAAVTAWQRISLYYEKYLTGEAFPATPSKNACRFCTYRRCVFHPNYDASTSTPSDQ